jgi:hypothetical protein
MHASFVPDFRTPGRRNRRGSAVIFGNRRGPGKSGDFPTLSFRPADRFLP